MHEHDDGCCTCQQHQQRNKCEDAWEGPCTTAALMQQRAVVFFKRSLACRQRGRRLQRIRLHGVRLDCGHATMMEVLVAPSHNTGRVVMCGLTALHTNPPTARKKQLPCHPEVMILVK